MTEMVSVSREKLAAAVEVEAQAVIAKLPDHFTPEQRKRAEEHIRTATYLEWTQPDLVAEIRAGLSS